MTVTDVEVHCAKCGKTVGIAVGDEFIPKGFDTMSKADIAPPITLAQARVLDGWFPCGGPKHHAVSYKEIAGAVALARARGRGKIDVAPDPSVGELLVTEDGRRGRHLWDKEPLPPSA